MFEDVQALYNDEVRRHVKAPQHSGRPAGFDASARGDNPMCGDRVTVFVRREDGRVGEAGFEARGCEITVASSDLMCAAVPGMTLDEVRTMSEAVGAMARSGVCPACDAAMAKMQALSAVHAFPSRVRCVTLPWSALVAAMDGREEAGRE